MGKILKELTKLTEQEIKELIEKAYHNDTSLDDAKKIFQKVYEQRYNDAIDRLIKKNIKKEGY